MSATPYVVLDVFDRLKQELNLRSGSALASELGFTRQSYSYCVRGGHLPRERVREVCDRHGLDYNYITTGVRQPPKQDATKSEVFLRKLVDNWKQIAETQAEMAAHAAATIQAEQPPPLSAEERQIIREWRELLKKVPQNADKALDHVLIDLKAFQRNDGARTPMMTWPDDEKVK